MKFENYQIGDIINEELLSVRKNDNELFIGKNLKELIKIENAIFFEDNGSILSTNKLIIQDLSNNKYFSYNIYIPNYFTHKYSSYSNCSFIIKVQKPIEVTKKTKLVEKIYFENREE